MGYILSGQSWRIVLFQPDPCAHLEVQEHEYRGTRQVRITKEMPDSVTAVAQG